MIPPLLIETPLGVPFSVDRAVLLYDYSVGDIFLIANCRSVVLCVHDLAEDYCPPVVVRPFGQIEYDSTVYIPHLAM